MLSVQVQRVFLARHRVDFRKRFDGLLGEAYRLGADPYRGDCILFMKRDRCQLRAIIGDSVGLYLICRRFEGGSLKGLLAFADDPSVSEISIAELSLLLEGASFTINKRAKQWRAQAGGQRSSSDEQGRMHQGI